MLKSELLSLDDAALKQQCRCEACRGTGPGGQKRNKTSSAVRLTHIESGVATIDDVSRSQHTNLRNALRKLRLELAVQLPQDGSLDQVQLEPVPGEHNPAYPAWVGRVAECLKAAGYQPGEAAAALGCSASRLIRLVGREPFLWQHWAQARQKAALPPLHQ